MCPAGPKRGVLPKPRHDDNGFAIAIDGFGEVVVVVVVDTVRECLKLSICIKLTPTSTGAQP